MWRGLVATVSAALLLVSPTFTGDDSSLRPRSALAQSVYPLDAIPEYVEDLSSHPRLLLDTQIENPPRNNNALELPERQAGDTIQFQLFVPGALGRQIQGYTIELALKGKTFASYIDRVSGTDLNGSALLSGVSASGNPTLSLLSLSAVAVPSSGYLGQVTLSVSRALTSSDVLEVPSASTAGPGGVQNLDVSQASLTFRQAPACPGDFNGDGMVNLADFLAFAGGFGARSGDANYDAKFDMDGSGSIDLSDFLAFAGVFGTTCPIPPSPLVSIPDANLRAVIEDSLGKARGAEITRAEMATLTRLEAPNSGIRDLTGIEFATDLTVLRLDPESVSTLDNSNDISDPSPLSGLTSLTELYLDGNRITDASALSGLTNLERLGIGDNGVTDLSALSGLRNLTWLSLHRNGITDVSSLSGMTSLKEVNLGFNGIKDVSALSGLTSLRELRLFGNRIADVSSVSGLTNLTILDFRWNGNITDVSALSGLTNLTQLYLGGNSITDVSALSGLTNLTQLYLDDNSVTNVSALSALTNLQEILDLSSNSIADISPLSGLTYLRTLYLGGNSIADVSALSNLTKLSGLYLDNNSIVDLSPLSGLTKLRTLHLYNNGITDLAPLVANTGLGTGDEVDVKGNPLSATSINVHVPALQAREVSVSFDEIVVFTDPRIYNDNVFVLPVTEDLAAGDLPLDEYATSFYGYFSDAFDFLVFMPSLHWRQLDSEAFGGAYYASVQNEVQGTGQTIYFDASWGSEGKLQGAVFFAHAASSKPEHTGLVWGPGLHELMHRWANFIVGPSIPHWDFTSANGILGGFDIAKLVDHGGGRYSAPNVYTGGWARNLKPYSPIEMYLAGFIPPEQVPDLWVAEDGEIVKSGRGGDPDEFTASKVKTHTVEDIIAKHGRRVPDHTRSQKAFRAAVILLASEDYPATRKFLEALSNDATLFSHAGEDQFDDWYNFYEATGGRATIAMDGLSRFKRTGASKRPAVRSFGTPPPPIVCHPEH
ncbi:MAG: leucine-rich repeat domain-containing protein [Gemmatimonadetes bacterium]|nr:leucine-rich repeat domain-containing protein [Gemmatimonadota bacterium]